ncbi:hypothetical protein CP97_06545 [Aurantiacibacter atlanticus]|uniref:DUF3089 domain-containing protein n=1 Tax=Aurantiacibacter atlanticus TaxID=1648404 RepID=A0A0H4VAY6_9SPHN|nr:DUF3089 domain-containing protein [Aurantiacibacter atlanticus]AKQ41752.1 hypothetical protein CP97_06545 [Aurantiacibacter atlanticus]MDF1833787.1 DUF3089 domain-containing protein [Alteraurantiacibacter sp. bin_em_oilr2.035]
MRKFLYIIVILIVLVLAVLFALRMFGEELSEVALVPSSEFVKQDPLETNAYLDPDMWFSRPGKGVQNDPARWQPAFADEGPETPAEEELEQQSDITSTPSPAPSPTSTPVDIETPRFAVFFVHPTSYFDPRRWNAPLDDEESQNRARLLVRGLASAFNRASEIWAPRYRQATFGAFITDLPEASQAIDAAYEDVDAAFDLFLDSVPADMPIVLAGHSQGGLMIMRLLQDRVAGTELQSRVVMAYPIGWPISIEHDLPSLGFPACATPDQSSCIVSWASFAEPPGPGQFLHRYTTLPGSDGEPRGESPILCVNPLTGTISGEAPAGRNSGSLIPNDDLSSGELVAGAVPARCSERGLLLIGDPPDLGQYVLPGNNYHVYDIPLFWKNLQQDVVRRVGAWQQANS